MSKCEHLYTFFKWCIFDQTPLKTPDSGTFQISFCNVPEIGSLPGCLGQKYDHLKKWARAHDFRMAHFSKWSYF